MLVERAPAGLHDFLLGQVIGRFVRRGRAVAWEPGVGRWPCVCGTWVLTCGPWTSTPNNTTRTFPLFAWTSTNPNLPVDWARVASTWSRPSRSSSTWKTPIGFLRNLRWLLKAEGYGVMTTPNVDNLPCRIKFLLKGRLRMMDEQGDPTHVTPIFWDLLIRQYLPKSGLKLVGHFHYPPQGYRLTRPGYAWLLRWLSRFWSHPCLLGDVHVFVLQVHQGP